MAGLSFPQVTVLLRCGGVTVTRGLKPLRLVKAPAVKGDLPSPR
jgi:hypothetical protein